MSVLIPIQLSLGDMNALDYVAKDQLASNGAPSKLIAMEGHWEDSSGYELIAWPSNKEQKNVWEVNIPYLGSVIAMKDFSGKSKIPGMLNVPKKERPWVFAVFYGFRIMFYGALVLLGTAVVGLVLRLRGKLFEAKKFAKWLLIASPLGILCVWGGWVTAEAGRQPYVIFGQLLTKDAVSHLSTGEVLYTFIAFLVIYLSLITAYIAYVARTVKAGPESIESLNAEIAGFEHGGEE
jgi:cytochrome d ubiquinol oxidase subunit I